MCRLHFVAASIVAFGLPVVSTLPPAAAHTTRDAAPRVVIDNPRVRIIRTTAGSLSGVDHGPSVVVALEESPGTKSGTGRLGGRCGGANGDLAA